MSFAALAIGTLCFASALLIHLFLWRLLHPKKDMLLLFALFLFVPIAFALVCVLFGSVTLYSVSSLDLLAGGLCYGAFSCAYIMTYPALQARCPSLRMLLLIERRKAQGLNLPGVMEHFDSADLIADRLNDLIEAKMLRAICKAKNGSAPTYSLTPRGALLLRPFMLFRRFLGLAPGEG